MKKFMFIFTLMVSAMSASLAQTEISGYLDATPADGITAGSTAQYSFFEAITACRNLVHDGKADWYLPSVEEILLFLPVPTNVGGLDHRPYNLSENWAGCTGANCSSSAEGLNTSFAAPPIDGGGYWVRSSLAYTGGDAEAHGYFTMGRFSNGVVTNTRILGHAAYGTQEYVKCVR